MPMSLNSIAREAFLLPKKERMILAQTLSESIEEVDEIEAAWLDEADRRTSEMVSGKVTGFSEEEVFRRIDALLKK